MIFRNNLDYEFALFDPHYNRFSSGYQQIVNNFEFVYFFIEKRPTTLFSLKKYDEDYLSYLHDLGFQIPRFYREATSYKNWWGDLENPGLERMLNSKLTSLKMAKLHHWCHPHSEILSSQGEINHYLNKTPYSSFVIKSPFFMSGKGFHWVDKNRKDYYSELERWFQKYKDFGPFIIEPRLKIILELGIYYDFKCADLEIAESLKNPLIHQNIISSTGSYKGGIVFKETKELIRFFHKKFSGELDDKIQILLENSIEIAQQYRQLGAQHGFGIDCFIYEENKSFNTYSLCEVNYRKTMGLMLHAFKPLLSESGVGQWIILAKKSIKKIIKITDFNNLFGDLTFSPNKNQGVILTSPPNSKFLTFYLLAENFSEMEKLKEQFFKIMLS